MSHLENNHRQHHQLNSRQSQHDTNHATSQPIDYHNQEENSSLLDPLNQNQEMMNGGEKRSSFKCPPPSTMAENNSNGTMLATTTINNNNILNEMTRSVTPFRLRMFILFCTLFENLVFSGIIFGWPALFYLLKNNQVFEHLCVAVDNNSVDNTTMMSSLGGGQLSANWSQPLLTNINNTTDNSFASTTPIITKLDCRRQENLLNMAYTIGIFSMGFTSFFWGFLLESKGLRFVRIALNILISFGCFLLSFTGRETSFLIIPAIIILGLIGVPLRIANMQIADFFPKRRSTVISFYSGSFSSSPVIFVLIKFLYDRYELSYFWSTFILFIVSVTVLPISTLMLPRLSVQTRERDLLNRWEQCRQLLSEKPPNTDSNGQQPCQVKANGDSSTIVMNGLDSNGSSGVGLSQKFHHYKPHFVKRQLFNELMLSVPGKPANGFGDVPDDAANQTELQHLNSNNGGSPRPIIVKAGLMSQPRRSKKSSKPKQSLFDKIFKAKIEGCKDVPLRVSLFSFAFLAHQLWFSWLNTYMVLYSGSMSLWLARVTGDDRSQSNVFTSLFGIVQFTAMFLSPGAGYVMDLNVNRANLEPDYDQRRVLKARAGYYPILITTTTLVCTVICRFFDETIAVYISIAFITLLRALMISIASAYIRVRFPPSHFNRLNGIMCTTGAFFSLLQFPLFYFESKSGIYVYYVNIFCAIMTALSLLNPISLGIDSFQRYLIKSEDHHIGRLQLEKEQRLKQQQQTQKIIE